VRAFRKALLAWFARRRRAMPWRGTRDPYRIWLAEVMLQQTRVAAVTPYYERFVRRFPTVRALARAREADVLRHWAGLGYYSRARNLHRAAKRIVAGHNGRFPRTLQDALALPGVGRYTAAAVLSIAYDEPLAALDGNVARVLARLDAVHGDLRALRRWRKLEERAQALLEARAPGDWNQAMMELGATVCTPRAPRCAECPVARWCRARALGIAERLPAKRAKPATVEVELAAAIFLDRAGRTLLVAADGGADAKFFARLPQFPALRVVRDAADELSRALRARLVLNRERFEPLPAVRHSVTRHAVTLLPFLVRVRRLPAVAGAMAVPLARVARLAVSSSTKKLAAAAQRLSA
jgi:A/G-specific adenine glycosylase